MACEGISNKVKVALSWEKLALQNFVSNYRIIEQKEQDRPNLARRETPDFLRWQRMEGEKSKVNHKSINLDDKKW